MPRQSSLEILNLPSLEHVPLLTLVVVDDARENREHHQHLSVVSWEKEAERDGQW